MVGTINAVREINHISRDHATGMIGKGFKVVRNGVISGGGGGGGGKPVHLAEAAASED